MLGSGLVDGVTVCCVCDLVDFEGELERATGTVTTITEDGCEPL